MSVSAKELLKEISSHDQSVMDVLSERPEGFTIAQIADKLKRPRKDVKYSIHNLKIGGHVKDYPYYGRVCLVDFDFKKQVIEKRPHEYVEKLEQQIADLERQLKAEREINDRLRVVETERAVRNDELYEALGEILGTTNQELVGEDGNLYWAVTVDEEMIEKAKLIYEGQESLTQEREIKYIAIQYSRGVYGSLFDSEQEAREEHPDADEIIPIRVSGDCDDSH